MASKIVNPPREPNKHNVLDIQNDHNAQNDLNDLNRQTVQKNLNFEFWLKSRVLGKALTHSKQWLLDMLALAERAAAGPGKPFPFFKYISASHTFGGTDNQFLPLGSY